MKKIKISFLLTILLSMLGVETFAYDAFVDGIYYNFTGTEATVTFHSDFNSHSNGNYYYGEIVIPETVNYNGTTYQVTNIGNKAFNQCNRLTSVTIPNSVTSIGAEAFYGCSGLTSLTIGNSVTSIGERAFWSTAWYNNQPDGLVYAGKVAYKYKGTMPSNTSIILAEGTLGITGEAFRNYSDLTDIIIPNSVTSIGDYAFSGCSGLTSFIIPNSVTSIGSSAFSGCSGLTSVTIGNSVTSIGGSAFQNCSGLTSVNYNATNCTNMGTYDPVFARCSSLKTIKIGANVKNIHYYAFYKCS